MVFDPGKNGPWFGAGRPFTFTSVGGAASVALVDVPERHDIPLTPVLLAPAFGRPKEGVSPLAEALIADGRFLVFRPSLLNWGDEAPNNAAETIAWPDEIIHWGRFLRSAEFLNACREVWPSLQLTEQVACVAVSFSSLEALHAQAEAAPFDAMALVSFVSENRDFVTRKTGRDYYDLAAIEWARRLRGSPELSCFFSAVAARRAQESAGETARRYQLLASRLAEPERVPLGLFNVMFEGVPVNSHKAFQRAHRGLWESEYDLNHQMERAREIEIPLTFIVGGKDDFNHPESFDEFIVGARSTGRIRRAVRLQEANHYMQPYECFEKASETLVYHLAEDLGLAPRAVRPSLARVAMRRFHETRGAALRNAKTLGASAELFQKVMLPKDGLTYQLNLLFSRPAELAEYIALLDRSQKERGDGTTILEDLEPGRLAHIFASSLKPEHTAGVVRALCEVPESIPGFLSSALAGGLSGAQIDSIFVELSKNHEVLRILLENVAPDFLEKFGRIMAGEQAKRAASHVPAYQDLLREKGCAGTSADIADYPVINKNTYITRYGLLERCIEGRLPSDGGIDESSGSSGIPTNWVRCRVEEDRLVGLTRFMLDYLFRRPGEQRPLVLLNAFSQGAWSSASKLTTLGRWSSVVKNIGTDIPKILVTLQMLGPDHHYVLGGYPPFLRELIRAGESLKGFSWSDFKIDLLHGGEGYTEAWLAYMHSRLGNDAVIVSSYGASDLDVGIAIETPFSRLLRKVIVENPALRRDLLKTDRIPEFIGQYNPLEFYLEEQCRGEGLRTVVATVSNPSSHQPKVRYDVGDEGGVLGFSRTLSWLKANRISVDVPSLLRLPLVFLLGRADGTISLDGANIYPNQVEEALLRTPSLAPLIRGFQLARKERSDGSMGLEISVETYEVMQNKSANGLDVAENAIAEYLCSVNGDFRESYRNNMEVLRPVIRLVEPGTLGIDGSIKRRYLG